jgi:hypothetical protein
LIFTWAKDLDGHFFRGDLQMADKHNKRVSALLIIRGKSKSKLTPIRRLLSKKKLSSTGDNLKELEHFMHCWGQKML